MATSTPTLPGGSSAGTSGAGAGSGSGSSPATPSTSTPSTPAAPATPAVQPSTPDFKTGDNSRDFLKGVMKDVYDTPEMKEALAEGVAVKPATVEPPKDEVKPAAETPAVEQTPEQKAAADAEAAKAKPAEVNPLDKVGPLPAEKLAAALTANPELEAALAKAGIDKETLFQTSRDAALASQFLEINPTPEAAKFAAESAGHFYDIEDRFPTINSVQDLDSFVMDVMLPLSQIRGADGQPLMNPDGKTFQTDGSVEKFMRFATDLDHGMIQHIAKNIGGEQGQQLLDAIAFIDEFRANGYKVGDKGGEGEQPKLPPAVEAELAQARADREKNTQQSRQNELQQAEIFETKVFDTTLDQIEPLVSETLNATSLDDYAKGKAAEDIWNGLKKQLKENRTFQQQLSGMRARGRGEDVLKELVALNSSTIKAILPRIMNGVLDKAGARQIDAQTAKQTKINGQIADDRMNRGGTSTGTTQSQPMTEEAMFDKAMSDATAEAKAKGESPSESTLRQRAIVKFSRIWLRLPRARLPEVGNGDGRTVPPPHRR